MKNIANECVYEHTTWQDWNYVYDRDQVSRIIYDEDGSRMLNILDFQGVNDREFLFTYQTEMVFTASTITWFELEYKCGGNSCYDTQSALKIEDVDPVIYIYNANRDKYIAIIARDNTFKVSDGSSNSEENECSQSLSSTGGIG